MIYIKIGTLGLLDSISESLGGLDKLPSLTSSASQIHLLTLIVFVVDHVALQSHLPLSRLATMTSFVAAAAPTPAALATPGPLMAADHYRDSILGDSSSDLLRCTVS